MFLEIYTFLFWKESYILLFMVKKGAGLTWEDPEKNRTRIVFFVKKYLIFLFLRGREEILNFAFQWIFLLL